MSDALESMIEKVKGLLRKAERTANEFEAEAFTAKANELIAKHQIDEALLGEGSGTLRTIGKRSFRLEGTYLVDKASLMFALSKAWDCSAFSQNRRGRQTRETWMVVYGTDTALTAVEILYASLLAQATSGALKLKSHNAAGTRSVRIGFFQGFTAVVAKRITTQRRDIINQSPGAGLVLMDDYALADAKMRTENSIKSGAQRHVGSVHGYAAGVTAGTTANIGINHITQTKVRALA